MDYKSLPQRNFVPGQQRMSARTLTSMLQSGIASISGVDGEIQVDKHGQRLLIGVVPQKEYNPLTFRVAVVLEEFVDYLRVATFSHLADTIQNYDATLGSSTPSDQQYYVAKPFNLQKTPWNGMSVPEHGHTVDYVYTTLGERTASVDGGAPSTEKITLPYIVGEPILIYKGPTGYTGPNGNPIFWTDANAAGRSWGGPTGGGTSTVTCSVLVEYDDCLLVAAFAFEESTPQPYDPDVANPLEISTASWSSGVVTFETSTPHGLLLGDLFQIIESTPTEYNGVFSVASVVSSTSVTAAMTNNPGTYYYNAEMIDLSEAFYVAKPYELERSEFDGALILYPNGDYHFFVYQWDVEVAEINNGGTSYVVNDIVTAVGGTLAPGGSAAAFKVVGVSGGVIDVIELSAPGTYSVMPTNPVSVTGGTGSGCKLNLFGTRQRTNTVVVPSLDGMGNFVLSGGDYVFDSTEEAIIEEIVQPYFKGTILTIVSGFTGLVDPVFTNPVVWTDINNAGRNWTPIQNSPVTVALVNSSTGSNYYAGTLYKYSPTGTPLQSRNVDVWVYDFMQVTNVGLVFGNKYAVIPTGKYIKLVGIRKPVYLAIGGWLNGIGCADGDPIGGVY